MFECIHTIDYATGPYNRHAPFEDVPKSPHVGQGDRFDDRATQSTEPTFGLDNDHLVLWIDDKSIADRINEVEKINSATADHLSHHCLMGRVEIRRQLDSHRNRDYLANPLQQSLGGFGVISDLRFAW